MSKPLPVRVEDAVRQMFALDRDFSAKLKQLPGEFVEWIDYPGNMAVAVRLLGVPEDNSGDYETQEQSKAASARGEIVCWDGLYDAWTRSCDTADEFIAICREWVKDVAERG